MGHVRVVPFLSFFFYMNYADAHLRGRATKPLALLQASVGSVEAQVEATSVGRWGATHSNMLALLSGAPGTSLLAAHEKMAGMVGRQGPATVAIPVAPSSASPWAFFTNLLIWVSLITALAYFWQGREVVAVDPDKTTEGFDDWKSRFCFWFEDPMVCVCACFCPAIRWAETMSFVPGLLAFWPAFFFFMLLLVLTRVDAWATGFVCASVLALMCTAYRQELRQKFGMQAGGVSIVTDCLLYSFCMCCAIAQEARHVEEALRSGHAAVMCPPDRIRAETEEVAGKVSCCV